MALKEIQERTIKKSFGLQVSSSKFFNPGLETRNPKNLTWLYFSLRFLVLS
jgi:hypothetical protein